MKSLSSFSDFTGNTSFLWKEIPLNKDLLGGKAEWAKDQLKNETADALGDLLEKDILTKEMVIILLDTEEARSNWNKNTGRPKNSARYTLALQAGLKMLGYDTGHIDALFGKNTKAAVIAFQTKEGLVVDGAPGPKTIGKMLEKLGEISATEPFPVTQEPENKVEKRVEAVEKAEKDVEKKEEKEPEVKTEKAKLETKKEDEEKKKREEEAERKRVEEEKKKATAEQILKQQEEALKQRQDELEQAKKDSIDNAEAQNILAKQQAELIRQQQEIAKAKQDSIDKSEALKLQQEQNKILEKQRQEIQFPLNTEYNSGIIVQDKTNIPQTEIHQDLNTEDIELSDISLKPINNGQAKENKKEVYGDLDENGIPDWMEQKRQNVFESDSTPVEEKKENTPANEIKEGETRKDEVMKEVSQKTTHYLANKEGKNLSINVTPAKALTEEEAKKQGLELMDGDFELNKNGFISVLFLGKDASGIRPDSIMQFLIDPYSGDMSQVSISRDICVKNSKGKLVKLNSLKKKELLGAIEDITGQDTKYETSVDINNFESVIQPLLDKNFPEGITVDFGDTEYEIAGKKYTGELKLNAKELLTVSRARKGVLKNGNSTGGSDTARRARQMEIISSALNPLNNNPLSFIRMASDASDLISKIEGENNINVRKFATDLFTNRPNRTTKSFTTKVTNGNVRIPYIGDKTHAAAYIDIDKTRNDLQGFFGNESFAINSPSTIRNTEKSMETLTLSDKTLLQKGMAPDILKFIKGRESKSRTVEGLLAERGYSMELISSAEQAPLNIKYNDALQKIDSSGNLPIGTYSVVLDAGKDLQKGYLIQKQERNWSFERKFPISTGKNGISNMPGSQGTPNGLILVENIINGHLDEIIKHKTPQGKNSVLNGPATVNTTALVLASGEEQNSSIASRGIYLHETEQIANLGKRDSGACIRTGTFVATEIGQYIKKNKITKTPIYIANTEAAVKPIITNPVETQEDMVAELNLNEIPESVDRYIENKRLTTAFYYSDNFMNNFLPTLAKNKNMPGSRLLKDMYDVLKKNPENKKSYILWLKNECQKAENIDFKEKVKPLDILNFGKGVGHNDALDCFIAEGSSVKSIKGGIITTIEKNWKAEDPLSSVSHKGGNFVIVFNPEDNEFYRYCHLQELPESLNAGDIIPAGTIIGKVGHTGLNANKPGHGGHLHLEINKVREDFSTVVQNVDYIKNKLYSDETLLVRK